MVSFCQRPCCIRHTLAKALAKHTCHKRRRLILTIKVGCLSLCFIHILANLFAHKRPRFLIFASILRFNRFLVLGAEGKLGARVLNYCRWLFFLNTMCLGFIHRCFVDFKLPCFLPKVCILVVEAWHLSKVVFWLFLIRLNLGKRFLTLLKLIFCSIVHNWDLGQDGGIDFNVCINFRLQAIVQLAHILLEVDDEVARRLLTVGLTYSLWHLVRAIDLTLRPQ